MSNKNGNRFMMKICKNHWWLAARAIISCERYATGQLADCKKPAQGALPPGPGQFPADPFFN